MLNTDSFLKCTRKKLRAEIMRKKTYIPMFNVFTGVSEGPKIFRVQWDSLFLWHYSFFVGLTGAHHKGSHTLINQETFSSRKFREHKLSRIEFFLKVYAREIFKNLSFAKVCVRKIFQGKPFAKLMFAKVKIILFS